MYHLQHGHPNVDLVKYLVDKGADLGADANAKNADKVGIGDCALFYSQTHTCCMWIKE